MKGYEYKSDFAKRFDAYVRPQGLTPDFLLGFIEGFTQGRIEQAARSLLIVFRARGLSVPDADRERILAQKDLECLERWLEKAVVATSVAAVFDEPD